MAFSLEMSKIVVFIVSWEMCKQKRPNIASRDQVRVATNQPLKSSSCHGMPVSHPSKIFSRCCDKSKVIVLDSTTYHDKHLVVATSALFFSSLLPFACFWPKLLHFHHKSYKTRV